MAPENDDELRGSGNLDDVRAWGERRDRAAKEAAGRAKEAEERAARYRVDAVKAAAKAIGLSEQQLEVLNTMNPTLEPEQVQAFAEAFNITSAAAPAPVEPLAPTGDGAPSAPAPAPEMTGPPAAPVVASSTGVPPAAYTTDSFLEASKRGDTALLERMATEVATGVRPLQLRHPEAQES